MNKKTITLSTLTIFILSGIGGSAFAFMAVEEDVNPSPSVYKKLPHVDNLDNLDSKIKKIVSRLNISEEEKNIIIKKIKEKIRKGEINPKIFYDPDGIDAEKLAFAMELKGGIKDNGETATPAGGGYTSVDGSPQEEKHIQNKLKLMEEALRKRFGNNEEKIQKFKEKYEKMLKERYNNKRVFIAESGKYKKPMEGLNSQGIKNKEVKRSRSGLFTRVERIGNKFERILNVKLSRIPDTNKKVALLEKIEGKLTKKLQKIEGIKETNPRKYELYKQVINKLLSIITEKKNELTQKSVLIKEDDFIESLF